LKLNLELNDFATAVHGTVHGLSIQGAIDVVLIDTRKIIDSATSVFFALKGEFRDGHQFIESAIEKGILYFVVSKLPEAQLLDRATFIEVADTTQALQNLAAFHRQKFNYPVIAITGSAGKTTVKEWLYHLLADSKKIIRSPKSYNSQIGVPLSLLELNENADLALIEVGISRPGEMEKLEPIVNPSFGIFTSFGRAHEENFISNSQHLEEKLTLFKNCSFTIFPESIALSKAQMLSTRGEMAMEAKYKKIIAHCPFQDKISLQNATLAIAAAAHIIGEKNIQVSRVESLPRLALRMELFEGIHGNTIINDTYNLDLDALKHSLEYQLTIAENRPRVVIIGLDEDNFFKKSEIEKIVQSYHTDKYFIVSEKDEIPVNFKNSIVLLKGTRNMNMQRYVKVFRLKSHKTLVEFDLTNLKENLSVFKNSLNPGVKLLAMVKAQSYGSGVEKMASFLSNQGIDYFGVAYADEGVELRNEGITAPILVLNAEEEGFENCIQHHLEPAIFSFRQLENFIKELIISGVSNFPVHIKIDTGMKRLGFELDQLQQLADILKSQPEIRVKSLYTHLAESDNLRDSRFTNLQISRFNQAYEFLSKSLNYPIFRHVLNSEGISNYQEVQYEMVRLGIGMYGISSNPQIKRKLKPVLSWVSAISQVKTIQKGDSVGYNRTFVAKEPGKIAVIPVGYADGFRRSLSNGKGGVFIKGQFCPTLGRVCMDMIMVDVTGLAVQEGDRVEIIGEHQPIEKLAQLMDTIPYEVMTGISKRVHRVYLED
jgi:alanine racemase